MVVPKEVIYFCILLAGRWIFPGGVDAAAFFSSPVVAAAVDPSRIRVVWSPTALGDSPSPPPPAELVSDGADDDDDFDEGQDDDAWLPDRQRAQKRQEAARIRVERVPNSDKNEADEVAGEASTTPAEGSTTTTASSSTADTPAPASTASPYTDEEERVIAAMGGKTFHPARKREQGYLGDSTLQEICQDYGVPVSYVADVLVKWGVPVPIQPHDRLGDLVTGEQAFALLEAVHSLDVGLVQDLYSMTPLQQLCGEWELALPQVFEFCLQQEWSLPFGVQTCLRTEQESEVLRVFGGDSYVLKDDDDDYGDADYEYS